MEREVGSQDCDWEGRGGGPSGEEVRQGEEPRGPPGICQMGRFGGHIRSSGYRDYLKG